MKCRFGLVGVCAAVAAVGIVGSASAEPFPIVGVDFDDGAGSPSNWNTIDGGTPATLNNLMREDGSATDWSFTLENGTGFTTAANPATIPSHQNSLDLISDYYYATGVGTARFSNLTPGTEYHVWVFGLRGFNMNNRITIEGGGAPITFDQVGTSGQLFVNGSIGDQALTLRNFAVQQTANANGEILMSFEIVPGGAAGWTIAGVGIFSDPGGTCIADWNGDGEVDINDFFAYLSDFEAGDPRADLNNDGEIDINDFFIFLTEFEVGC